MTAAHNYLDPSEVGPAQPIVASPAIREQQFGIHMSSELFKLLADDLYPVPHVAAVREALTNADDAHVEAGTTSRPIEIHLPNAMEPWLSVKDFGTGLSYDRVFDVYFIFGLSTKVADKTANGKKGIGAKAPFAYTQQWNIASRYNGELLLFTAFKNNNGAPTGRCDMRVPTVEANGMEIKFACQSQHFEEIAKLVARIEPFLRTPLKVTGNPIYDSYRTKYQISTPTWKLREYQKYGGDNTSYAIMGGIAYPIDRYSMGNDIYREKRHEILTLGLDIVMPNRSLSTLPNRSGLKYDDITRANIIARLDEIHVELPAHFEHLFSSAPTYWEACVLYTDHISKNQIVRTIGEKIQWRDQPLTNQFEVKIPNASVALFTDKQAKHLRPSLSTSASIHVKPSNRVYFFINDIPIGGRQRFYENKPVDGTPIVYVSLHGATVQDVLDALPGIPKPVLASECPKPQRVKGVKTIAGLKTYDTYNNKWKPSGYDGGDGGIYVLLHGHEIEMGSDVFYKLHRYATYHLGIPVSDIVGVPKTAARVLKNDEAEWRDLREVVREHLEANLGNAADVRYQTEAYQSLSGNSVYLGIDAVTTMLRANGVNDLVVHPDLQAVVDEFQRLRAIVTSNSNSQQLRVDAANVLNLTLPQPTISLDHAKLIAAAEKRVPMLSIFRHFPRWASTAFTKAEINRLKKLIA